MDKHVTKQNFLSADWLLFLQLPLLTPSWSAWALCLTPFHQTVPTVGKEKCIQLLIVVHSSLLSYGQRFPELSLIEAAVFTVACSRHKGPRFVFAVNILQWPSHCCGYQCQYIHSLMHCCHIGLQRIYCMKNSLIFHFWDSIYIWPWLEHYIYIYIVDSALIMASLGLITGCNW